MDAPHDYFDEPVAATYDDDSTDEFSASTIAATVDVLAALAGAGSALELAVGTGRIAVPLAERGVPVVGIDLSDAMVARLLAKRDDIPVTIGDIATARVDGTFSLVYLVFNTVMNLLSQDAQVACFRNAAAHLDDGEWTRASIPFRYDWPAELDLMAAMAGMRLRERWSGWDRAPFTSESRSHVSVWERQPST